MMRPYLAQGALSMANPGGGRPDPRAMPPVNGARLPMRAMPPQMAGGPGKPMPPMMPGGMPDPRAMPPTPMSTTMPIKSTPLMVPPSAPPGGITPTPGDPRYTPGGPGTWVGRGGIPGGGMPGAPRGAMPGAGPWGGIPPGRGALSALWGPQGVPGGARRPQLPAMGRSPIMGRGIPGQAPNGLLRGAQDVSRFAGNRLQRIMGGMPRGGLQRFAGGGGVRKKSNA